MRISANRGSSWFSWNVAVTPSRVNFITGRYPHSHGSRENNAMVGAGEPHMFRVLRAAGYQTAVIGKNHMFWPEDLAKVDFAHTEHAPEGSPEPHPVAAPEGSADDLTEERLSDSQRPDEQATDDHDDDARAPVRRTASNRKGRPSVPSWDDIVFGTKGSGPA